MEQTLYEGNGIVIDKIPSGKIGQNLVRIIWQDENVLGYIRQDISKTTAEDIADMLVGMYEHGKFSAYHNVRWFTSNKIKEMENV